MKSQFCLGLAACAAGMGEDNSCHAISAVVTDDWCINNCNASPPNCPEQMCKCDMLPSPPPSPVPTPPVPSDSKTWAVLAAGSSTYWNYRHQSRISDLEKAGRRIREDHHDHL